MAIPINSNHSSLLLAHFPRLVVIIRTAIKIAEIILNRNEF